MQQSILFCMRAGDLASRLARSNPWWRSADWQRDDRYLRAVRDAPFDYEPGPLRGLEPGGLYLLRGPRRVGKSTEVRRAVANLLAGGVEPRRVLHLAVDGWSSRELVGLVEASPTFLAPASDGIRYWFIDEITGVRGDWPSEIKWLRDNDSHFADDTVVLTGSAAERLGDATKAFAGRQGPATDADRTLLPMSFTDFCQATQLADLPSFERIRAQDLSNDLTAMAYELAPWISDLVTAWEVYLTVGGFPQAVASWMTNRRVDDALVRALWKVVSGDALERRDLTAVQTVALLDGLAKRLASPVNMSDLARNVGVSRTLADAALADLVRSYLAWPVHREGGLGPNLRAQAKYYFTDPLLARLASIERDADEPDLTRLAEQQVGLTLLRAVAREKPDVLDRQDELMYYRSKTGAEVDFVGRLLGGAAVESKYVDGRWGRELQTLRATEWTGIVATRSVTDFSTDASVLPAPILAVILGG